MTLSSFALLLAFLAMISVAQILQKKGLGGRVIPVSRSPLNTLANILRAMFCPLVLAGLSLYVIGTFTWLLVLSRVNLSVAYPMMSMSYIMVMLLSVTVLHEKVNWKYAVMGLVCIGVGVSFIGLGMG